MKKLLAILLLLPCLALAGDMKTIELNSSNTISFNDSFNNRFVSKKQVEAINLCAQNVGSEINIVMYSPGGSIGAGQRFIDTLKALPCTFNTITVFGASMAYQTVQQLGARYILPSGILMSHRASVRGLSGEIGGELDSIVKLLTDNVTALETIASTRVGISLEDYRKQIADELWLTTNNAIKNNHADEVVLARCDKSLSGTNIQTVYTMFGAFEVRFSNCPLVTGILEVVSQESGSNPTDLYDYYANMHKQVYTEL